MPSNVPGAPAAGTKQKLDELGPEKFSKWVQEQPKVLLQIPHGVMRIQSFNLRLVCVQLIWLVWLVVLRRDCLICSP